MNVCQRMHRYWSLTFHKTEIRSPSDDNSPMANQETQATENFIGMIAWWPGMSQDMERFVAKRENC